jgi:tetratricopeptide (TPR) repeat protein
MSKTSLLASCRSLLVTAFIILVSSYALYAQDINTARELMKVGKFTQALSILTDLHKKTPKDYQVMYELGHVYSELDKADSALKYYIKAEDEESVPMTYRGMADGLSGVGKFKEALVFAEKAIKKDDKDILNYLAFAQVMIDSVGDKNTDPNNMKAIQAAEQRILKARQINANSVDVEVAYGNLQYAQKIYELAKDAYEKALSIDQNLLKARENLATTYYRMANKSTDKQESNELFSKALVEWDKLTRLDTNNARAWYEKGKIQYFAKQYREAIGTLRRAQSLDQSNVEIRWFLSNSAFDLLDREKKVYDEKLLENLNFVQTNLKGLENYSRRVSQDLDSLGKTVELMLAKTYYYEKKLPQAVKAFADIKKARGLKDDDLNLYSNALINNGDTTTAFNNYFETIEKYGPAKQCGLLNRLVGVAYNFKRFNDVLRLGRMRIASCNDTNNVRVRYFIGLAYFSLGQVDSAVTELSEVVKQDTLALDARNMLVSCYTTIGARAKEAKDAKGEKEAVAKYKEELGKAYQLASSGNPKLSKRAVEQVFLELCQSATKEKRNADTRKYASDWVKFNPSSEFGNLYLAIGYQVDQNNTEACKYWKEVLKINPNNKTALEQSKDLGCK